MEIFSAIISKKEIFFSRNVYIIDSWDKVTRQLYIKSPTMIPPIERGLKSKYFHRILVICNEIEKMLFI